MNNLRWRHGLGQHGRCLHIWLVSEPYSATHEEYIDRTPRSGSFDCFDPSSFGHIVERSAARFLKRTKSTKAP